MLDSIIIITQMCIHQLSSNMIFAMIVQRMMCKGFQGYLAYVVETGKEGTLMDEIPVV